MVKYDSGNVLLKPCHRRQMANDLKRVTHLGDRIGDFGMTIAMRQIGRSCEMTATVHDSVGDFTCRSRQQNWRFALRDLIRTLCCQLRAHRSLRALAPAF
ncbi:MAG: hypothetical protein JO353_10995 [Phycisphaerae bacterium]|nr:hypothetical protein [Phycisphaerae bacterium]